MTVTHNTTPEPPNATLGGIGVELWMTVNEGLKRLEKRGKSGNLSFAVGADAIATEGAAVSTN